MKTLSDPTISEQKQFWETWNPKMRDPEHLNEWCIRRAEVILQFFQSLNLERPNILDFGCGTGWLSEMLAKFGAITGVDLAESAIATARARCPNGTFFAGDIFKLSLPANHYDVVVSQEVIAHVPDQLAYVNRAANVLKPGGYLIITTPNKFVIDRADVFPPQPPEHIERWLTIRRLKNLLRSRFRVLRSTSILPMGNRGILRFANSTKVNAMLSSFISIRHIEKLKEQLGLGYTLILLAQKQA
jgi:2-polyprenyl-3-methyl-5-hydroxy-6-metoxy-1,4-benzoquinol methylase